MPDARLAERVLSLVTTPERASAIVGDLLEDRGAPFWESVATTAVSILWREMHAAPGITLVRSVLFFWVYCVFAFIVTAFASVTISFLVGHTGLEFFKDEIAPGGWVGAVVWYVLAPLHLGRAMGLTAHDRELATAAVAALIWPLLAAVTKMPLPDYPLVQVCLLAGAAWVRWNQGNLSAPEAYSSS